MYSAGILPFTFINKKLYILIGRERYDKSYSDFGGKYDKIDKKVVDTALREFQEETLYTDIDITYVETNSCNLYTESKTLKGNTYYMFLIYFEKKKIDDILYNFKNTIDHSNECEKDHLILIKLSDLLSQIIKSKKKTIFLRKVFENTISSNYNFFEIFENLQLINLSTINNEFKDHNSISPNLVFKKPDLSFKKSIL